MGQGSRISVDSDREAQIAQAKAIWRRHCHWRWQQWTGQRRGQAQRQIAAFASTLACDLTPRKIFTFLPSAHEPDVFTPWLNRSATWQICLPVLTDRASHEMEFVRWHPGDSLRRHHFGLYWPENDEQYQSPGPDDLVLLPCVGADVAGSRLGRGGGYYDRWLGRKGDTAQLWVTVFSDFVFHQLPQSRYDIPAHALLTERGLFAAGEARCCVTSRGLPYGDGLHHLLPVRSN